MVSQKRERTRESPDPAPRAGAERESLERE